jgi:hypothetical protein
MLSNQIHLGAITLHLVVSLSTLCMSRKTMSAMTIAVAVICIFIAVCVFYNSLSFLYPDITMGWWIALGKFGWLRHMYAMVRGTSCENSIEQSWGHMPEKFVQGATEEGVTVKIFVYDLPRELTGIDSFCQGNSTIHHSDGGACWPSGNRAHEFVLPPLLRSNEARWCLRVHGILHNLIMKVSSRQVVLDRNQPSQSGVAHGQHIALLPFKNRTI